MDYKVLRNENLSALIADVGTGIQVGWELIGGGALTGVPFPHMSKS